jgi:uncharacterized protein YaiI (UPF0178 family)
MVVEKREVIFPPDPTPTILEAQIEEERLEVDRRLMQLLESYHVIVIKDTDFAEKLTWCLENCQNKFRDLNNSNGRAWYFQNEQDAVMFAMKWS